MIRVLLSLDLNDASREQRDDLYEILKGKNWKKAKHVDTVWTLTYPDYDHDSEDDFKKSETIWRKLSAALRKSWV